MFIKPIIHTQAACNYLMLKYKHEYNNKSKTGMGGVSESFIIIFYCYTLCLLSWNENERKLRSTFKSKGVLGQGLNATF